MKIYKDQKSIEADIKDGVLAIEGDVKFECSFSIEASIIVSSGDINAWDIDARDIDAGNINARDINAGNINARDINARNINARDINAGDINAGDINAWDIDARDIDAGNINARDINAGDINAGDINARDIDAGDINARDIDAGDILYYAFCCVYQSIKCLSIKAKREIHQKPICLDGELTIVSKKENPKEIIIDGATYILKKENL